ncbi:MAG: hypothetical protein ACTSU4_09135, partial [Promethearchaeota archaeon]
LDIDNTLYYNPLNDFSIEFDEDNVVSLSNFFNAFNSSINHVSFTTNVPLVLITGRDHSQETAISTLLRKKGFEFYMAYFIVSKIFFSR